MCLRAAEVVVLSAADVSSRFAKSCSSLASPRTPLPAPRTRELEALRAVLWVFAEHCCPPLARGEISGDDNRSALATGALRDGRRGCVSRTTRARSSGATASMRATCGGALHRGLGRPRSRPARLRRVTGWRRAGRLPPRRAQCGSRGEGPARARPHAAIVPSARLPAARRTRTPAGCWPRADQAAGSGG